jgi:hypothetical protein
VDYSRPQFLRSPVGSRVYAVYMTDFTRWLVLCALMCVIVDMVMIGDIN